jgi:hypothetical protein
MSAVGLAPVEPVAIFGVKLIAEQAHAVHAETIASGRREALHALCNSILYAWGEGHGVVGQVNRDDELQLVVFPLRAITQAAIVLQRLSAGLLNRRLPSFDGEF